MSDNPDKATDAASVADILKHAGGSESDAWNEYIGSQALASIRPYIGDEEKPDKMRAVVAAGLTGIAPRDELEGMIAAQMIACHDTAMGCFRDALAANKTSRRFRDYLNQAGKLSRTFAMLLDALNRHRGKGMQKITVEHVHVHSSGQAVVGVVEAPGGGAQPKSKGQAHAKEIINGLYDEGYLVTIAPALNYHVQDAAEAYQAQLREPEDGKARFVNFTLEDVIEVIRLSDPPEVHNRRA